MNRTAFKVLFFVCIGLLISLIQLTFIIWILANVGVALVAMLLILSKDVQVSGITLGEFFSNFIGSPMFYAYAADLILIAVFGFLAFWRPRQKSVQV